MGQQQSKDRRRKLYENADRKARRNSKKYRLGTAKDLRSNMLSKSSVESVRSPFYFDIRIDTDDHSNSENADNAAAALTSSLRQKRSKHRRPGECQLQSSW